MLFSPSSFIFLNLLFVMVLHFPCVNYNSCIIRTSFYPNFLVGTFLPETSCPNVLFGILSADSKAIVRIILGATLAADVVAVFPTRHPARVGDRA